MYEDQENGSEEMNLQNRIGAEETGAPVDASAAEQADVSMPPQNADNYIADNHIVDNYNAGNSNQAPYTNAAQPTPPEADHAAAPQTAAPQASAAAQEHIPTQAGIVYHTDGGASGYGCNYVQPRNGGMETPTPKKKKAHRGNGIRVCALIIAAVFTLTFVCFSAFTVCDRLGVLERLGAGSSNGAESDDAHVFQMTVPTAGQNVGKTSDKSNAVEQIGNESASVTKEPLTLNQISEKCLPSSVGILVRKETSYFGRIYTSGVIGSGFILSEDGYIATNNHVVEGASSITVVLNDGTEYEAEIIGTDPVTDIGVIKIDAQGLPVMEVGNSDDVKVGDLAVAIGTPATIKLAGTFTDGIISAVNRKIDITDDFGNVTKSMRLIQTNATINPGNSGGPLINAYGQVIGINTLKLTSEYEGVGFAIPINGAVSIINQLIRDGSVSDRTDGLISGNTAIGIQCSDITDEEAEYYSIPKGVLVIQIDKTGSAAKAGLRRGDIITEFDGKKVESVDELNAAKQDHSVGDEVTITVYRDGEGKLDITFRLDIQTN